MIDEARRAEPIRRARGQTTLDFAVGASVFLLAVVFVIAYAPTMFDPFAGGSGSKLVVADHAATSLSGDLLAASTADPGTLSTGCVVAFFEGDPPGEHCPSEADFGTLDEALSLNGRNAEVTIHDLDTPASEPVAPGWADGELTRSNSESTPSDIAVATRTVSIEGTQYRLTVRVW